MFYLYDGSFEGLLSAITMIMRSNPDSTMIDPAFCGILEEGSALTLMDYMTVDNIPGIVNDFGEYIRRNFGEDMTRTIYQAYLSEIEGIENAILEYIYLARKLRIDPVDQLYRDCVKKVAGASRRCGREANRYLGLLRFRKKSIAVPDTGVSETGIPGIAVSGISISAANEQEELFIAECEPESCCLPLIADHFVQRFSNQRFIIFDKRRHICVIHIKGHEWIMRPYEPEDIGDFETRFEHLWQKYFKALSIPERENPKLQMGIMPKRYWKYLIEKPGRK